jgi:hypothetical protein
MSRGKPIVIVTMLLAMAFAVAITAANPGWRISRAYPGVQISVHHSYSPDPSPYDLVRMLSPVPYIGPGEYTALVLRDLPYSLRFDGLRGERVGSVYIDHCVIEDISAFLPERPFPYVAFHDCDLSRLPADQRTHLRETWDSVKGQYVYSLSEP